MRLFCPSARLQDGWADDVVLHIDAQGRIAALERGVSGAGLQRLPGPVVPGMANAHSHAFQWAMAGLAERASHADDSFWTWREAMYGLALRLSPDALEDITALAYASMLEAGYTSVAEFHYLHHAPDGRPYDDPAEMSLRVLAAAEATGIGLTLLPVLYRYSGVGQAPPEPRQRRFLNTPDALLRLVDAVRAHHASTGAALHSLRAVGPDDVDALVAGLPAEAPLHLHLAEQVAEVQAVLAATGQRPLAWLADHVDLGPRWSLVHATHLDAEEVSTLPRSGATAVICPTTEADLGDGFFPAVDHLSQGGAMAIGSDSHVIIDPWGELRLLESGQRLLRQRRNVLQTTAPPCHLGDALWTHAAHHGARALGRPAGALAVGRLADLVVLDASHRRLAARPGPLALDTAVFAGDGSLVREVWVAGRRVVADGRHVAHDALRERLERLVRRGDLAPA